MVCCDCLSDEHINNELHISVFITSHRHWSFIDLCFLPSNPSTSKALMKLITFPKSRICGRCLEEHKGRWNYAVIKHSDWNMRKLWTVLGQEKWQPCRTDMMNPTWNIPVTHGLNKGQYIKLVSLIMNQQRIQEWNQLFCWPLLGKYCNVTLL